MTKVKQKKAHSANDVPAQVSQIVDAAEKKICKSKSKATDRTCFSLAYLESTWALPVIVPMNKFGELLDEVSLEFFNAGYPDMQIFLQKRTSKAYDPDNTEIHGTIIDVDYQIPDVVGACDDAGIPHPNFYWETKHGAKLVYIFEKSITESEFEKFTRWICVAIKADPASANVTQAQYLPKVLKTISDDDQIPVEFETEKLNPDPIDTEKISFYDGLPNSLTKLFAGPRTPLSSQERSKLEVLLTSKGIPVPKYPGSKQGQYCPNDNHSSPQAFKLSRWEKGVLDAHCFSCNRHWSERQLFDQFVSQDSAPSLMQGSLQLTQLPYTWATVGIIKHRLEKAGWQSQLANLAIEVWTDFLANEELQRLNSMAEWYKKKYKGVSSFMADVPDLDKIVSSFKQRVGPWNGIDCARVFFDEDSKQLSYFDNNDFVFPIKTASDTLGYKRKSAMAYWVAGPGRRFVPVVDEKKETVKKKKQLHVAVDFLLKNDSDFEAHYAMALGGNPGPLKQLGLPIAKIYSLPVCFVEEGYNVDPQYGCVHYTLVQHANKPEKDFDLLGFFRKMFDEEKLPFATWNDVLRFIMAIAAGLVREIAYGQQGIYWIVGDSGVGKLFVDTLLTILYSTVCADKTPPVLNISVGSEIETQRSLHGARSSLYLRFSETKKGANKIATIIQMSGSAKLPIRGMGVNPYDIDNHFVFIADAAEGVADGREASRRTTAIHLSNPTESLIKNEILEEYKKNAHNIIGTLSDMVNNLGEQWFKTRPGNYSRPFLMHALSEMLNVELDEIVSEDMTPFFEAIEDYSGQEAAIDDRVEHFRKLSKRKKESRLVQTVPSYRYSHLKEFMTTDIRKGNAELSYTVPRGYKDLFKKFPTSDAVLEKLRAEADGDYKYGDIEKKKLKYLPVELGDKNYGFLFVCSGNRNFVFMDELELCKEMEWEPHTPGLKEKEAAKKRDRQKTEQEAGVAHMPNSASDSENDNGDEVSKNTSDISWDHQ
ncbi:MAG: hypothetical protein GY847_41960 [Proteobacteria bacterium]|nr:hypothetical protein [Pseudomonadota bacterium]